VQLQVYVQRCYGTWPLSHDTHQNFLPVILQDMGLNNWFYINVMLDNSELFVPLPDQLNGEVEHALNSKLRGVALRWEQLRVGYFFGGDGEKILRLNAHELSMIGRLPEVVHSQVRHCTRQQSGSKLVHGCSNELLLLDVLNPWYTNSLLLETTQHNACTIGKGAPLCCCNTLVFIFCFTHTV